ncbi:MAG: hypothetical protein LBR80_18020 [Deltaproteobacteria bacterium]|jgi:hypothetical protein|nr:hypothetical protein [Deltaproteobacteria bacterium]
MNSKRPQESAARDKAANHSKRLGKAQDIDPDKSLFPKLKAFVSGIISLLTKSQKLPEPGSPLPGHGSQSPGPPSSLLGHASQSPGYAPQSPGHAPQSPGHAQQSPVPGAPILFGTGLKVPPWHSVPYMHGPESPVPADPADDLIQLGPDLPFPTGPAAGPIGPGSQVRFGPGEPGSASRPFSPHGELLSDYVRHRENYCTAYETASAGLDGGNEIIVANCFLSTKGCLLSVGSANCSTREPQYCGLAWEDRRQTCENVAKSRAFANAIINASYAFTVPGGFPDKDPDRHPPPTCWT